MSETDKMTIIDKRMSEVDNIKPTVPSTAEIMMTAVRNGLGKEQLEVLERMFLLDVKAKEQAAKEAYYKAMSDWSADAPVIIKDKEVKYKAGGGTTSYKHASLANVAQAINSSMAQYGLHVHWRTAQPEGKITVSCTATHELGHSESTTLTADADTSGSKNPIQAIGSTISYLERYTILALTGLATHEQDTDGIVNNSEVAEPIDDEKYASLLALLQEVGKSEKLFCRVLKVDSLDNLPESKYDEAVKQIQKFRK